MRVMTLGGLGGRVSAFERQRFGLGTALQRNDKSAYAILIAAPLITLFVLGGIAFLSRRSLGR